MCTSTCVNAHTSYVVAVVCPHGWKFEHPKYVEWLDINPVGFCEITRMKWFELFQPFKIPPTVGPLKSYQDLYCNDIDATPFVMRPVFKIPLFHLLSLAEMIIKVTWWIQTVALRQSRSNDHLLRQMPCFVKITCDIPLKISLISSRCPRERERGWGEGVRGGFYSSYKVILLPVT